MKRAKYFLNLIFLISTLIFVSCGKDNLTLKKPVNEITIEPLIGKECSCDSTYMPVSGINSYGATVTYDNICIANCHSLTSIVQGRYPCTQDLVCMDDMRTSLSECRAQADIRNGYFKSINNFKSCNPK